MSESLHIGCPHCQITNRVPRDRLNAGAQCGRCHQPLFPGKPVEVDSAAFRKLTERTDIPVVVDFWASWCGPCTAFAPHFERAATELEPEARLVKVNTEQEAELASQYGIRSIPTLMILHQGREIARQAGAMDSASFVRWVRDAAQQG